MDKHTPGPWLYSDDGKNIISMDDEANENFVVAILDGPDKIANAQRIVACVNACEGIPNEDLEGWPCTMGQKSMMEAKQIATLTAQRDRLIGMLKNHHDTLVDITDSNPTLYAKHSSETCVVCKTLAEIEG